MGSELTREDLERMRSVFTTVGYGRRLDPDPTVAKITVDPVLIDTLRDYGLRLIDLVEEQRETIREWRRFLVWVADPDCPLPCDIGPEPDTPLQAVKREARALLEGGDDGE